MAKVGSVSKLTMWGMGPGKWWLCCFIVLDGSLGNLITAMLDQGVVFQDVEGIGFDYSLPALRSTPFTADRDISKAIIRYIYST